MNPELAPAEPTDDDDIEVEETEAAKRVAEAMREAGDTPARLAAIRAREEGLRRAHPGRYAARRERWSGDELAEPYILAVGDTADEVEDALDAMPADLTEDAVIGFIPPLRWLPMGMSMLRLQAAARRDAEKP